ADPRAIDQDARRPMGGPRLGDGRLAALGVADIAFDRRAADLACDLLGALLVDVEYCDLGAGFGECPRRRGAEARSAAGDDGGATLDQHWRLLPARWRPMHSRSVGALRGRLRHRI